MRYQPLLGFYVELFLILTYGTLDDSFDICHIDLNPSNAEATFGQSTRTKRFF